MRGLLCNQEGIDGRSALCEFCGDPRRPDLLEVWGRDFLIEYCCEMAQQEWEFEQRLWGNKEWTDFVQSLPSGETARFQRVSTGEGRVRLHFGLRLASPPRQKACRAWIKEHHRHNAPPAGWMWAHAAYNGSDLVGIAWVGRPVSRVLQGKGFVEVNRCCITTHLVPHDLVHNACSMLYGAAAREAKRRGCHGIVTYTRADETGSSVRAANFTLLPMPTDKTPGVVKGRSWGCRSRPRDTHEIIDKKRWARIFKT